MAAQDQPQGKPLHESSSDLARQNLSLVAASAPEIKAVLVHDPGLMVELKTWIAQDATDHGQMIAESDLSDDAVYDRLDNDLEFRGVATRLLQRYGYFVPMLNPQSQIGMEQMLLVQERAKWLAQHPAGQAQPAAQGAQRSAPCSPQAKCAMVGTSGSAGQGQPAEEEEPIAPPLGIPVQAAPLPSVPAETGGQLERADLSESNGADLSSLAPGSGGQGEALFGIGESDNNSTNGGGAGGISPELIQQFANQLNGASGNQSSLGPLAAMVGGSDAASASDAEGAAGLSMNRGGSGASGADLMAELNPFSGEEFETRSSEASSSAIRRLNPAPSARIEPAEMVRTADPYSDIPSLYDMYLQAQPHPKTPTRFGAEVFQQGTRDMQMIPMDLPVGPDYVVGPGDALAIDLWGTVSHRIYRTVDREGRVSLPEVGPVLVSGKSLADVQQEIQGNLRTQFRDISADVSLSKLRTIRIYEVGDVREPGAYDVSALSTPLSALFEAGGPTARGSMRIVKHYRGNQLVQTVDLYDLLLHGVKSGLERLENGDTVLVPPIGPQVTIEGMVRRPAVYELKDETHLADVLDLAGGLLPAATLKHIEVERLVAHDKRTMLSLTIPESQSDAQITATLNSFAIQDGDRIRVFPVAPYNEDAIYLEGHVLRPGRYSYQEGMRLTDVISSYKDLLPEPASQYAEIIRLNAPDFHPSVESFNLANALANPSEAPVLHPMDTVRIFSRYDFQNPPTVSVFGDVRAPGTYRASGQIHLSDAVHVAGGLAPDAEMDDAQVFRYLPDGTMKIFSVSLSRALDGDPSANILLESRDRLLVHRSPNAVEPAVVYVEGEVGTPGRYPLTANMTVADLIRVGGGLKPSADPRSAVLTQYSWTTAGQVAVSQDTLSISDALAGKADMDQPLHNGDVLTIRTRPGWNELGASITIRGAVRHPGTYGIRPGERLSDVIERAGGFLPSAYPYGAVLQRPEVRHLEEQQRMELIAQLKGLQGDMDAIPAGDQKQSQTKAMATAQFQSTLVALSTTPPLGRVDIRISSDVRRWKNTGADITVRGGDTLTIPRRPDYVMVTGNVFNPTAVAYRPGHSAKWYLSQSGGPTILGDKKAIFVVRADGSVVGEKKTLWIGDSLSAVLEPGDTVVVPQRAAPVGGVQWQNIFMAGQMASSIATALYIALHY